MADQLKIHYVLAMAMVQGVSVSVCGIVVDNINATRETAEVTCGRCQKVHTVELSIAERATESVESEYVDYPDLPEEFLDLGYWASALSLGTDHLPAEVVQIPFTLSLWFNTRKDNSRVGGGYSQFTFGDRENPKDLTAEEVEYVRAVFELFLKGASE